MRCRRPIDASGGHRGGVKHFIGAGCDALRAAGGMLSAMRMTGQASASISIVI